MHVSCDAAARPESGSLRLSRDATSREEMLGASQRSVHVSCGAVMTLESDTKPCWTREPVGWFGQVHKVCHWRVPPGGVELMVEVVCLPSWWVLNVTKYARAGATALVWQCFENLSQPSLATKATSDLSDLSRRLDLMGQSVENQVERPVC